jgi:hypothetical protein
MSNKTTEQLIQELIDLQKQNKSGGINLPDPTKFFSGTFENLAKLNTGTATLSDGFGLVSKVIGVLPGVGEKAGSALLKVGNEFIAINTSLNDVAKSGYNFDRNLGTFTAAVTSARMSVPEFQNFVRENGRALGGLAGTANDSAQLFLRIGKGLAETTVVRDLQATGMGFDEFNKILAISTANRRGDDLRSKSSQIAVIESATAMATEMDNVARLTGISRQEQQKAIEAQMKKNEVEIATMAMDDNERTAFEAQTASLSRYGKSVQDVFTALSTGGLRTAEDTAKAAAIGPEFTRLATELAAANKDTSAGAEDRRRAIKAQMDNELLRIANDKDELRNRAALATSGGEFGKQQAEFVVGAKAYAAALKNIERDAEKAGISVQEQRRRVEAEFAKDRRDAGEGKGLPGTEVASMLNRADALIKDASAGVALNFKGINDNLTKTIPGLDALNSALKPFTVRDTQNFVDKLKEAVGPDNRGGKTRTPDLTGGTPPATTPPAPNREALGSKDVFGDWFNGPRNRLSYIAEDELEATVPLSKVKQFIGDMSKKMPDVLTDARQGMSSSLSEARSTMPDMKSMQSMFEGFKMPDMASISSNTTAPSTTISDQNTVITDVAKGINDLNMRMERLISAVEDGADKNVKAVRSRGNILA